MSHPAAPPPRREFALAAALFVLLTVVLTWPQAVRLNSVSPHMDAPFNLWRLAWFAHAMATDPRHLFDANIFWPEKNTLAYSDAMPFEGVLAAPFLWAGVPTPIVYNLLLLASFVFSACAAYALARHITGRTSAAIVAGVVFAFAPFRFDHYMHFELLWSGWMPLAVLALLRAFEDGRARWGALTGLFAALQTLSSIYYGLYLAVVLAVMTIVLALGKPVRPRGRTMAGLACGAVLAGALVLPYIRPYQQARAVVGERGFDEVRLWSAGPKHFLAATPDNWLYGSFSSDLSFPEKRLFVGIVGLLLAGIGLWPPFDRRRIACLIGLAVAVNIAIGFRGVGYHVLWERLDLVRGLRAPARGGQLFLLFTGLFAAWGAARLLTWFERTPLAWARFVVPALTALLALEFATMPVTLVEVPPALSVSRWLADQPAGPVLVLPVPKHNTLPGHERDVMYQSTFHWKPLINGHSGNWPLVYMNMLFALDQFPSESGLAAVKRAGVRYIVLIERWYGAAPYQAALAFLDARPDVTRRGEFADDTFGTTVFEVKP